MSAKPFRLAVLDRAKAYADKGVHEDGENNRGPDVEHFQRANHGQIGEAWCADFLCCCMMEAAIAERAPAPPTYSALQYTWAREWVSKNFVRCSPSVEDMWDDAGRRGIARPKSVTPQPGWLAVYHFKTGHHIEIVQRSLGAQDQNIGGNTGDGDPRDGDGVAYKTRPKTYLLGYIDLGNS